MDISYTNPYLLLLLTLWYSFIRLDAQGEIVPTGGGGLVDYDNAPTSEAPSYSHKDHQSDSGVPPAVDDDFGNNGYDYGSDSRDYYGNVRDSQYVDRGIPTSCCAGISQYLSKLSDEQHRDREQTHQYHMHLAGLVQTVRDVLAQLERSTAEAVQLRALVMELRRDVNQTRKELHQAVRTTGGFKGCDCKTQCMAEARGRPIVSMGLKEVSLCRPMPIPNPSFEVHDRSWAQYIPRGYAYWTGPGTPDGNTAIKVVDGGARRILRFPPGTSSVVIAASSRSIGVPGGESNNYSIYCDVKRKDGRWQYAQIVRFAPNHDWHERRLKITAPEKTTLMEAWCYLMFRRFSGGTAYFDNVRVWLTDPKADPATCK